MNPEHLRSRINNTRKISNLSLALLVINTLQAIFLYLRIENSAKGSISYPFVNVLSFFAVLLGIGFMAALSVFFLAIPYFRLKDICLKLDINDKKAVQSVVNLSNIIYLSLIFNVLFFIFIIVYSFRM